ncbi:DUF1918 domain-containing protein [Kitasatospora sp. NBC_01302]|uniref:DUF1918 domain-containing protein n=1 Tax=Kitasatospora sp. NBC_01302 TaxID=2903575 RepID=UPI002E0FDDFE|nr:DUF1918 domain-containing protein [Kitasatospora sp. NBC_01302]
MEAGIGDRVIVEGTRPGAVRRDGRIVALHHEDGSPPWDVLWSDNGHTTTLFPGPDTHLHHFAHSATSTPAPTTRPSAPSAHA